jgi:hypothetical protein
MRWVGLWRLESGRRDSGGEGSPEMGSEVQAVRNRRPASCLMRGGWEGAGWRRHGGGH